MGVEQHNHEINGWQEVLESGLWRDHGALSTFEAVNGARFLEVEELRKILEAEEELERQRERGAAQEDLRKDGEDGGVKCEHDRKQVDRENEIENQEEEEEIEQINPDGSIYRGKQRGVGELTYSDGSKYIGGWNDGKKCNKGVFVNPDGTLLCAITDCEVEADKVELCEELMRQRVARHQLELHNEALQEALNEKLDLARRELQAKMESQYNIKLEYARELQQSMTAHWEDKIKCMKMQYEEKLQQLQKVYAEKERKAKTKFDNSQKEWSNRFTKLEQKNNDLFAKLKQEQDDKREVEKELKEVRKQAAETCSQLKQLKKEKQRMQEVHAKDLKQLKAELAHFQDSSDHTQLVQRCKQLEDALKAEQKEKEEWKKKYLAISGEQLESQTLMELEAAENFLFRSYALVSQAKSKLLQELLEREREHSICKVCFEKRISCVVVPCGHAVVCEGCQKAILKECPICRKTVHNIKPIFYS